MGSKKNEARGLSKDSSKHSHCPRPEAFGMQVSLELWPSSFCSDKPCRGSGEDPVALAPSLDVASLRSWEGLFRVPAWRRSKWVNAQGEL